MPRDAPSPPPQQQQQNDGDVHCKSKRRRQRQRANRRRSGLESAQNTSVDIPLPEEPRVPPPEVHRPGASLLECNSSDAGTAAPPAYTKITPWMVLSPSNLRSGLEFLCEDMMVPPQQLCDLLITERHFTLVHMTNTLNITFDAVVNKLMKFAAETPKWMVTPPADGSYEADPASQRTRPRQPTHALRRYRRTPRIFGCYTCEVRLPLRRSLEAHFDSDEHKNKYKVAVCAACGTPASSTAILEWHVFVAHQDVAGYLMQSRWPHSRRHHDHTDCSFCGEHRAEAMQNVDTGPAPPPVVVEQHSSPHNLPLSIVEPTVVPLLPQLSCPR